MKQFPFNRKVTFFVRIPFIYFCHAVAIDRNDKNV